MSRGITITVLPRRPDNDEYGDPSAPDEDDEGHTIGGCIVAPRTEGEIHDRGRSGVVVGLTLYAPAGSDLLRSDVLVIADGDPNAGTWEVEGEPGEWRSPFTGWKAGIQVALRRAEG